MASEWAMERAREDVGIFGGPSKRDTLILAIATEIDAARAQGRREGLEEAAKAGARISWDLGNAEFKAGARAVTAEIRALIAKELP